MSYDGQITRYTFSQIDFGAGSNTLRHIIGPKGKKGQLYDYGCFGVTEAFAGDTSRPQMAIGTVSDADHYGEEFDFGTLAVAGGGKSIRTTYAQTDTGFDTNMLIRELPADTVIMVTCVAAVGTPTGIADAFVDIVWDN